MNENLGIKSPDGNADPSVDEVRVSSSYLLRLLFVVSGTVFLILGCLGIFLPILPTTPFLLLTAACYARGSDRFYVWLLSNPLFGSYIRDWREHKSLPLRTKIVILLLLWVTIILTSLFAIPAPTGKALIFLVPLFVTILMIRIPTRAPSKELA